MKSFLTRFVSAISLALVGFPAVSLAESLEIFRGDPDHAINLAQGTSVLVRSPKNISDTSVGSLKVADLYIVSRNEVVLTGKNEGRTTLTMLDDTEVGSVTQVDVLVTPNTDSTIMTDKEAILGFPPILLPSTPKPQVIEVINGVAPDEIPLTAHQAIVLKTDVPFTKIVASDDAVAASAVLWNGQGAYIIGKSAGSTTVTLSREGTAEPTNLTLVVTWLDKAP